MRQKKQLSYTVAVTLAVALISTALSPILAAASGVSCTGYAVAGNAVIVGIQNGSGSLATGTITVQALVRGSVALSSSRYGLGPGESASVPVSFGVQPSSIIQVLNQCDGPDPF